MAQTTRMVRVTVSTLLCALLAVAVTAPVLSVLGQPEMEPMEEPDMEPMMAPDDDDGSCMLTDGQIVPDGYSGFDTGSNYCNTCGCNDGFWICTLIFCEPLEPGQCVLTGSEVVDPGYQGFDTGANYCNTCTCQDSILACTEMACPPIKDESPVEEDEGCFCPLNFDPVCGSDGVTYSNSCQAGCEGIFSFTAGECDKIPALLPPKVKPGSKDDGLNSCILSGGEIVPDGFSGPDTADNYCNTCGCNAGLLACTLRYCLPVCELEAEVGRGRAAIPRWYYDSDMGMCQEFVWGGVGGNPNNFESEDECKDTCKPEKSTCTLTGGEIVEEGWSGKDTGSNSCNTCRCGALGLSCPLVLCPN